ncbi:MAG: NAD(P)H-hydrate dehydratase [Deltaproteobacteria bacterium]
MKPLTPILSAENMRRLDRETIAAGTAGIRLMENAGHAICRQVMSWAARLPLHGSGKPSLLICAGPGNNGGDGLVVARLMAAQGWDATVALCSRKQAAPGSDAHANLERWQAAGGRLIAASELLNEMDSGVAYTLVVDALFGTGFSRPLGPEEARVVEAINGSRLPVIAIDLPSGLSADTGQALGPAIKAVATVTLGAGKPGLFKGQGPELAGRISVADIGLLTMAELDLNIEGEVIDERGCRSLLSPRPRAAHKGDFGHVLVVAGSRGKSGAAVLASRAALRGGAGLVTMALPASLVDTANATLNEAMTLSLADRDGELDEGAWEGLAPVIDDFNAVVAGPGLGRGPGAETLVLKLLELAACPLVLDADALNILAAVEARRPGTLRQALNKRASQGKGEVTLTPHPGEMARLARTDTASVQAGREETACKFAEANPAIVVLKGAATLVVEGQRRAVNTSGNPGMASAGMGDVLAGLIAAIRAQTDSGFEAAALAVYVHGAAADLLADRLGGPGFLAGEVADAVPAVVARLCPQSLP